MVERSFVGSLLWIGLFGPARIEINISCPPVCESGDFSRALRLSGGTLGVLVYFNW